MTNTTSRSRTFKHQHHFCSKLGASTCKKQAIVDFHFQPCLALTKTKQIFFDQNLKDSTNLLSNDFNVRLPITASSRAYKIPVR